MERQNTISPYLRLMRLHQPVGIWLLLWPCWWALALAHEGRWQLYAFFALGAVVMRAAGCIINDMCDCEFDAQVERTKNRPLASGELSMRQARMLLILLLTVALVIAWWLGKQVVFWSVFSLPLIAAYPLMKRITWWPQLFLGLTFNWGALVAWVAARGEMGMTAVLLYIACIFWTLGYDTIYAHQDKIDDEKAGVKSTARMLGQFTKPFVFICYALFAGIFYYILQPETWALVLLICMALHLLWQVVMVRLASPLSCKKTFSTNALMGWLPFVSIILTKWKI